MIFKAILEFVQEFAHGRWMSAMRMGVVVGTKVLRDNSLGNARVTYAPDVTAT